MAFDSEEEFLTFEEQAQGTGWDPESDYAEPKDDARLNMVKGMGTVRNATEAASYQQRRMTNSMKQAWYKLKGDDKAANDLQKIIDHEDKVYKNYLRSPFNEHRTAAAVGNVAGGVTHPVSMATMPLGGGSTLLGRAAAQGGYGAAVEALTNPGGVGDRLGSAGLGFVGGTLGSAGSDIAAKGISGLRGNWTDPVAREADKLSKRYGTEPGIGQLREYSGKQMTPDQLKDRGANWPYAIEKHAQHRQEVDARKLKEGLGATSNPNTSSAFPATDAKQLEESLRLEAENIWKPFRAAAKTSKFKVRPDELWGSLRRLDSHNSKLLRDSSAIPDDEVRRQLKTIVETEEWTKLPKFTPEEYSKIVSELSNAQNRVKTLSQGQTPTYDGAAVGRITEAFDKATKDMGSWGKKDPNGFAAWDKARTEYQEKILPVKENPIFRTSKDLDKRGRDVERLMGDVGDGANYDHMRDLLGEYKSRYMDSAAERLDLLDANSLAAQHAASGKAAIASAAPNIPASKNDLLSMLGDSYTFFANRPSVKGMYFGDPLIPNLENMSVPEGALKSILRRAPIATGRETGEVGALGIAALLEILGFTGDEEIDKTEQFSHGIGPAQQAGAAGR